MTTLEDHMFAIKKLLDKNPDGLGFNQIVEHTKINREMVHKSLVELKNKEIVSKSPQGKGRGHKILYNIIFSESDKGQIAGMLDSGSSVYGWENGKTKAAKASLIPQWIQLMTNEMASQIVDYYFLPNGKAAFRFFIKYLEEHLEYDKKAIQKTFSKKQRIKIQKDIDFIQNSKRHNFIQNSKPMEL